MGLNFILSAEVRALSFLKLFVVRVCAFGVHGNLVGYVHISLSVHSSCLDMIFKCIQLQLDHKKKDYKFGFGLTVGE